MSDINAIDTPNSSMKTIPLRMRSKTNLSITSNKTVTIERKSFSVYGSSSQLSSAVPLALGGNRSHKLGELPAYLKKLQARTPDKEAKTMPALVVTEHEKSHQLGQRPAYLSKGVKSKEKGPAKKELSEKQKKQLDVHQEVQLKGAKIADKKVKSLTKAQGDESLNQKDEITMKCFEEKLRSLQNVGLKLCQEFLEETLTLLGEQVTESATEGNSEMISNTTVMPMEIMKMVKSFKDKLSIEGENYNEQIKNILSELNHHLPKEQVKIVKIDGKTAEQNELLMKKSAELTKEIEELKRKIQEDDKKTKEIDKKYLELFNERQTLAQEKAEKDVENANHSKRVKTLEKQLLKANKHLEMQSKTSELKETTNQQLRDEINDLHNKLNSLNDCIEQLKHTNDRTDEDGKRSLEKAQENIVCLVNDNQELLNELEHMKTLMSASECERGVPFVQRPETPVEAELITSLKLQIDALEAAKAELIILNTNRDTQLHRENLDLIEQMEQLRRAMDESDDVLRGIVLEGREHDFMEEIKELKHKLESKEAEIDLLKNDYEEKLRILVKTTEGREHDLKEEIKELKHKLESKEAEVDFLKNDYDDKLRILSDKFNDQLESLQDEVQSKSNEILQSKNTIDALQQKITAQTLTVDEKKLQVDNLMEQLRNETAKLIALEKSVNNDETRFDLAQTRKKLARKEKLLQEFNEQMDKDQKTIRELHGSYEMHLKLLRVRGEVITELEQTEKTLKQKLHAAQAEIDDLKVRKSKLYRETTARVEELEDLFSTLGMQQLELNREQSNKKALQEHLLDQKRGRLLLEQRIAQLEQENAELCSLLTNARSHKADTPRSPGSSSSAKRMKHDDSPTKECEASDSATDDLLLNRRLDYDELRRLRRNTNICVRKYYN